jgi:hypothetical protein
MDLGKEFDTIMKISRAKSILKTKEQTEKLIKSYFKSRQSTFKCPETGEVKETIRKPTITGLALHLGLTRSSIYDYMKTSLNKEVSTLIKQAVNVIQSQYEEILTEKSASTAGVIFWLKNQKSADWKDKQEIEHSVDSERIKALEDARDRVKTLELNNKQKIIDLAEDEIKTYEEEGQNKE